VRFFFKRAWVCGYDGGPRHPPGPRAPPPPVKEAWLVRLVGPGCIRYRECTQVHNIYTVCVYIYIYINTLVELTNHKSIIYT
jgi:hypothetical protein